VTHSLQAAQDAPVPPVAPAEAASAPWLHRVVQSGNLRYLVIGAWALALTAVLPWTLALAWFGVAVASGYARTLAETRITMTSAKRHAQLKLVVATVSGLAWAGAPMLSFYSGHAFGPSLAVGLLLCGYMLVFTQMRAAPRDAIIVSSPYSLTGLTFLLTLVGTPGFWALAGLIPVLFIALVIKVVITSVRDRELMAVNRRQAELIEELKAARDKADAANAAKSNFLGVISHELRTPMNGVLGAAQLLRMGELNGRQKEFVDVIQSSGEGLLMLLNDILDITKIEAGKMDLALQSVETTALLDRLVGPFEAQARAKGLDFRRQVVGALPQRLHADPLRLAQIVHNLLGNAVKFTGEGVVSLTIAAAPAEAGRTRMTFAVQDSGIGIHAEDLNRLFQPFSQVDASSTRRFGGTGLGLSISQRLAQMMDGAITVTSTPGVGSTFTLTVDVAVERWDAGVQAVAA
jgi:two-component system, sensor histidine kinase